MAKFKKGDAVQQAQPTPLKGAVLGFAVDQETGDVVVKVGYKDADGNEHHRHFDEAQLEKAQPTEVSEPTAAATK